MLTVSFILSFFIIGWWVYRLQKQIDWLVEKIEPRWLTIIPKPEKLINHSFFQSTILKKLKEQNREEFETYQKSKDKPNWGNRFLMKAIKEDQLSFVFLNNVVWSNSDKYFSKNIFFNFILLGEEFRNSISLSGETIGGVLKIYFANRNYSKKSFIPDSNTYKICDFPLSLLKLISSNASVSQESWENKFQKIIYDFALKQNKDNYNTLENEYFEFLIG